MAAIGLNEAFKTLQVASNDEEKSAVDPEPCNDDHFALPQDFSIRPKLENITMQQILNWKSIGKSKPHSAAHVAILYLNKKNKTLYVAMHQRSDQLKNGKHQLGWPGGVADHEGEDIFASTVRELKEECFSKTNTKDLHKHLHLIHF